ncbi:F0F1 ATP synthase subunit delta [Hyphomicrobium sulfonivorans]|nr:F0F1 ATP synthase subunit delta [Hyphomicrobium sulfonivorans]NSL71036.1 F0F1 ATP synthase subunit delta [Hyphomicrobium sulfonivorans]
MLENPRTLQVCWGTTCLRPPTVRTEFPQNGGGCGWPFGLIAPVFGCRRERFHVATDNHMTSGVAGRYASALFELAREQGELDGVDADLSKFQGLLNGSEDLKRLVNSPAFAAEDQERALKAVLDWASVGATTGNFLKVVARNRRLSAAEDIIKNFRQQLALHRGEMTAEVQSAVQLSDEQLAELKNTLKASYGKDVRLETKIDPSLLGGLVVKVGSRMFDSSLRTKLSNLKVVLKGA